ncbi:MAG: DMT family transporter [Flavobacteriaceae bacterium]|nr:DMT family transporter [Flavobacteriaceae bacterium]
MKSSGQLKGILLAFVSVIAVSNVYIFSKAALMEVSLPQFGVYWFSLGLLWIFIYGCTRKTFRSITLFAKKNAVILVALGLLEVVGTYFFFKAIHTISNPAITSFIGNVSPVFIIILSFLLLKERFNLMEFFGMTLAVSGAFVISYKGDTGIDELFIDGTQYVIYSGALAAVSAVIIKKNIKNIDPVILTVNRTLFLLVFSVIALIYMQQSLVIDTQPLTSIFIGSLLGPFLTVIAGYLALQYIPLSQRAIINSTRGLFVLLGAYLYFNEFPRPIALIGGLITIVGLLLIAFGKKRMQRTVG